MEASAKVVPASRPSGVAIVAMPMGAWVETEIWHAYSGFAFSDS